MPSATGPTSNASGEPSNVPWPAAGKRIDMRGTASRTLGWARMADTTLSSICLLTSTVATMTWGATTRTCSSGNTFLSTTPRTPIDRPRKNTNAATPMTMPNADSTKWRGLRTVLASTMRTRRAGGIMGGTCAAAYAACTSSWLSTMLPSRMAMTRRATDDTRRSWVTIIRVT